MRKLLPLGLLACGFLLAGCASDYPTKRVESPVNVTHEVAFGDYRRVFNTTYHILNRYGVVRTSSYRYGEITALVSEDTSMFDKTRREIEARIFDAGDYYEVECRVLIKVEDSEPATFQDQFNPRYSWKTVASDSQLEVRLNNEIREALTGGAWKAKEPLTPQAREPYMGEPEEEKATKKKKKKLKPRPKKKQKGGDSSDVPGDSDEVSDDGRTARRLPGTAAFERLGVQRMRRGYFSAAEKAFRTALKTSKDQQFAHYLLAQAQFSQGQFQAASTSLAAGWQRNRDWASSNLDVRSFYGPALKTFPKRLTELETACATDSELNLLLGYMRFFSDDPEGALIAFDSYLAKNKDSAITKALRALARKKVDAAHGLEDY